MKKLSILFLALVSIALFVTEAGAAKRGWKKCYTPRPGIIPPAGLPICPQGLTAQTIKLNLHEFFAEEEKAFPELRAYLDDESKPPFQLLKQKGNNNLMTLRGVLITLEGREAFAKESGINSFLGIENIGAFERAKPVREKVGQSESSLMTWRKELEEVDAQLNAEMTKRDRLETEAKQKKEERDKWEADFREEERKSAEIPFQKTTNIQGPIWLYADKIKVAADKLEDVAKVLAGSESFDAQLAKKAMQEAHIDPAALAKDMRMVADAVGPLDLNGIENAKELLKGRMDHAIKERDSIYALAAHDRAEKARLDKELADIEKEIKEHDASRKWHDQAADNMAARCGQAPLECPVLLAVAAAERAAAAKEQGHIGLLRAKQAFMMPWKLKVDAAVGFNELAAKPQSVIADKLKEQIDELDKAKQRLEAKIGADRKSYENSHDFRWSKQRYEQTKNEYNAKFKEYNDSYERVAKLLEERQTRPAKMVQDEEKRLGELKAELARLEGQYTKGGVRSASTVAAASPGQRSVQSLGTHSQSKAAPRLVFEEPKPLEPVTRKEPTVENRFAKLDRELRAQDGQRDAQMQKGQQEFVARRAQERAEFERKMTETLAAKQKELEELERKEKEARLVAEKAKADAEKNKAIAEAEAKKKEAEKQEAEKQRKLAEEAAKKKALEEEAKKQEAEKQKKLAEEAAKKKEQEELARKQAEEAAKEKEMQEAMRQKRQQEEEQWAPPPPPAEPKEEERWTPPPQEKEPEVVRQEPQEEAPPQCERGTWSPTFRRCIEDEPVEQEARPDCPAGTHWSPTLRSCQPD